MFNVVAQDDLGKDEVHPGAHKGRQQRVSDDGLGQGHRDFPEAVPLGGAVDIRRLVHALGDQIKEALGDVEAQAGAAGVHQHQRHLLQRAGLQEAHALEDVVNSDHGHEAGEHTQHQGHIHKGLAHLEADAAHDIGDAQGEEGGQHHGAEGDHQGVGEPTGKVDDAVARKEVDEVVEGVFLGEDIALIRAGLRPQRGEDHVKNGENPDNAQHRQQGMASCIGQSLFALHYWNAPSSL